MLRSIRRWHAGKLIILWSWALCIVALVFGSFMNQPIEASPKLHLLQLLVCIIVALCMSAVTWIWLGDRKSTNSSNESADG